MITKKFIEKIHYYFDELNYRPKTNLDFDAFCACADNTLAHTETLEDAANTIILYSYCIKKWNKIEKIFSKKSNIFNSLFYRGNSLISLVNDIEAKGVYHITNGINRNVNDIFVISTNDDYSLDFSYKKGVFSIFEDGKYFLKYPNSTMRLRSKASMDMLDKDKNILCNIVLNDNLDGVFLTNNKTPYFLDISEGATWIYEVNYINSLNADEILNKEKAVACFGWDITGKNSSYGVSKLMVFKECDLEMLFCFAASVFLCYYKWNEYMKMLKYWIIYSYGKMLPKVSR